MSAAFDDSAVFHNDDKIRVHDGGYTLCDYYLCRFGDKALEACSYKRVGFHIDRARRVVKNKYLRLFEERACNTQTLLLSARYVRAALFYLRVVAVGEGGYEFVRLSELARFDHFLIRCVFVAPAEIILYRSGEQQVFLKHERNRIAQRDEIVIAHVVSGNLYGAPR